MQHLDEGTIHAWLDGALPPLEAEQVATHAAQCAECAAAVAEARGIIAGSARIVSALDDVPGGVIPARRPASAAAPSLWRRLRLTPARAALAAMILLAVSTTLTMRNKTSLPNLPMAKSDSAVPGVAATREAARPVPATIPQASAPPPARSVATSAVALDSVKIPGPKSVLAAAVSPRRSGPAATEMPQHKVVAEQRQVADAVTSDSAKREMAKTRVAAQDVAVAAGVARGTVSAAAPAAPAAPAPAAAARNSFGATSRLEEVVTTSTFEGCYRLSADSVSGSTALPSGLPTSFALSRALNQAKAARDAEDRRADSSRPVVMSWRQMPNNQASVTFAAGQTQLVSLVLTAGSPVAVASSGDRTTTVRVSRSICPTPP